MQSLNFLPSKYADVTYIGGSCSKGDAKSQGNALWPYAVTLVTILCGRSIRKSLRTNTATCGNSQMYHITLFAVVFFCQQKHKVCAHAWSKYKYIL